MSEVPPQLVEALRDRYVLERELGRGGMATVYLARDLRHDRHVALKVLRPELAVALGPERFQREIRFAARLQHPHILSVYDSGESAGQLWFTMPYVEGESLRDRLRRDGALPLDGALRVAREAAEALGYAHEHGVIHRDVKPENIMLTRDGNTLVADFGIARSVGADGSDQLTATGMSLGTPAYMSPEQAAGAAQLDGRSDIYSLGCVLYEMLAGEAPFTGTTPQSVIAKRFTGPAPSLAALRDRIPAAVEEAVARALCREPADRFATAGDLAAALAAPSSTTRAIGTRRTRGWLRWAGGAATALAGAAALAGWYRGHGRHAADVRWATREAIPLIRTLADSGRWDSAYAVAQRASAIIPRDSVLATLWPRFSDTISILSEPSGARVYRKSYATPGAPWTLLGVTPLTAARLPFRVSRIRLERDGRRPLDLAVGPYDRQPPVVLDSAAGADASMVRVAGGEVDVNLPGLDHLDPVKLGDFKLGRYEVTNREFKQFVQGGAYQRKELWKYPFVLEGHDISWEEAVKRFTDKTGRPGPASWEGGDYPTGQGDYPVTGVSWYEAAAYAAFAGAALPTIYHWSRAAHTRLSSAIVPLSNFSGKGPAPVGQYDGLGLFGTYDMAGNAREWCINESGEGRYILGGGWNDPTYAFNDAYAQPAFDRSLTNGFRLAKYSDQTNLAEAARPIARLFRDFTKERPVSDAVFEVYRRMYDYDRTSLNARVEIVDSAEAWLEERVSFDAAYGKERVTAYLFLPKQHSAPLQTLVLFPGSDALHDSSSASSVVQYAGLLDFIIKSGRALAFPIYKSTYERRDSLHSDYPDESNFYKEHVIAWAKDMRRTIDYLDTRSDVDTARIAYFGLSWGGYLGGLMPAVEPRFKTVVLLVAGLEFQRGQPEVEPINFLPRIRIPVLMLNGQYDHYFPVETSQKPMFRLLGTPPDQKRQVIFQGGHFVPRAQLVKETLDWLDRYLGPPAR